jgi:hypothetical protein
MLHPYYLGNEARRMRLAGHVACIGEMKNAYSILGKISLIRPRHRWKDNINLRDVECEHVDWMHLAQDRDQWWTFVNPVMNVWVP